MRQEDSILLLCTGADAANTSIQRRKPLRGSNVTAATLDQLRAHFSLWFCCLLLLMSNKPPHILISIILELQGNLVKVAERGALPTESISSNRWRSLMLRISLRERRSSSSRGRGESCGDKWERETLGSS